MHQEIDEMLLDKLDDRLPFVAPPNQMSAQQLPHGNPGNLAYLNSQSSSDIN